MSFLSYQTVRKGLIKGIGDDCAVCQTENSSFHNVFTSDATIEDIHFNSAKDLKELEIKQLEEF